MLILDHRIGSTNASGDLTCARCNSKKLKLIERNGPINVYKCQARGMNFRGKPAICNYTTNYHTIPFASGIDPKDLAKRPELAYGPMTGYLSEGYFRGLQAAHRKIS